MRWQFWQNPKPQGVPQNLRQSLASQYSLDSRLIDRLRTMKKSRQFSGRPVQSILVFDPDLVDNGALAALKYAQVEKGEWRKALLFEVRIEKTGEVYLSDQRPKRATPQPA